MAREKPHVSPTVYGIETEYSCMMTFPDDTVHEIVGSCHSVDSDLGLYVQPSSTGARALPGGAMKNALLELGIITNDTGMLSNGARLYIDPSGPEYDTPETSSAQDATHRTFEGDQVLLKVLAQLREAEILKSYQVNRRIVDHNRSSRGIHLNTMTTLGIEEATHAPLSLWIASLNVAKGALFGSGGLLVDAEGNTAFHHSPRLSVTTDITAEYGNYHLRPLVRVPFKPDESGFSRIETVTSDALNFAWPIRASLVMTNALIKLIELGHGDKLPIMSDKRAVESAHNVGLYGSEGVMYLQINGEPKFKTALDVLKKTAEIILECDGTDAFLDKESAQVVSEVVDLAERVAEDKYAGLGQVESTSREVAMQRKMERDGLPIDSERMCRFDYAWDWIGGGGIAETLRQNNKAGWLGFDTRHSPSVTRRRLVTPPQDTRARIRGEMIRVQGGTDDSSWDIIDFGVDAVPVHPLSTSVPDGVNIPEDLAEKMNV